MVVEGRGDGSLGWGRGRSGEDGAPQKATKGLI